ncbi:type IV pilin [Methanoregula sp.]|uniref:type IV pilin n=1 Tax=Methanoregula sp. TaxID=2052170 RepID=UPI0026348151|nr:type IV pilin [Methanoregula sp.]MDD5142785.1 type IV pilin [Methanoregula sp.]
MTRKKGEDAVSPVVGVMLMLVVTVIIAAVVSGFAGGLVDGKEKAPTITMNVEIKNTGSFASSIFKADVLAVTEPIATKDLKLVTSWTNSDGTQGGAEVTGVNNTFGWGGAGFPDEGVAPWGYGQGVKSVNTGKPGETEQQFGNYILVGGTTMYAYPAGQSGGYMTGNATAGYGVETNGEYTDWEYTAGTTVDGMQAVLGKDWETLKTGDVVSVKLVHTPSGMTIFKKDVVVG